MAWEDGFKIGYEMNKVEIPSLNANLAKYQETINTNKQIKAQQRIAQQKSLDDYLAASGKSAEEGLFKIKFDNTGIFKYDVAADKVKEEFNQVSAMNNWLLRTGAITKDEHGLRQRRLTSEAMSFADIYKDISERNTNHAELIKAGQDNVVNGFRAELIEYYAENFAVSTGQDGDMKTSTLAPDGRIITTVPSVVKGFSTIDTGANIDGAIAEIIDKKGSSEYMSKDGAKIYEDYALNTERIQKLVDVQVNGFTEAQVVDAAFKLGIRTSDKEMETEYTKYMDAVMWSTLKREDVNALKNEVKAKMSEYTKDKLQIQFSSKVNNVQKPEETLLPTAVQGAVVEPVDVNKTFFQAQEGAVYKAITNYENPFAEGVSEEIKNKYAEFNPDLVELVVDKDKDGWDSVDKNQNEPKKKLQLIPREALKINAINVPIPFSSKEIMGLGVSSSSDKQWDNIDGFVVIKRKRAKVVDGIEQDNDYSIRLRGSVLDYEGKVKEATKTPKAGQGTEVAAQVQEQSFKRMDDISAPIKDDELGRVWSIYIGKNKELSTAYQKTLRRAQTENLNLNDPKVSRELIGQTIEQFFLK